MRTSESNSKAKLANILMLVRFLDLGSEARLPGSYKGELHPSAAQAVSPLVLASGPATITVSAALQLLAVLMVPSAGQVQVAIGGRSV
jgi:hypothetical protein